jgi:uncharacterized SAM-binding protein YcdF (DUF218 family)
MIRLLKIVIGISILFFLGMAVSGHLLTKFSDKPVEDIDIYILFKGDESRHKAFYQLLDNFQADRFFVPGVSDKTLQYWDKKYDRPVSTIPLTTKNFTTSTFEDVLQADSIIRQSGFKTIMLVTSDYHMFRAWALLRIKTLSAGTKIHITAVSEKNSPGIYVKQVFNESVKFWGSLLEYAYYGITGRLIAGDERVNRYFDKLRRIILFES